MESKKFSRQSIALKYGIGKSTVHDIHKRKDQIRSFAMKNPADSIKRRRVDVETKKSDESYSEEIIDQFEVIDEKVIVEEENQQAYEIVYEPQEIEESQMIVEKTVTKKQINNGKRRSNTLTIRQKYEILKELENGTSVPKICSRYSIGRTTVYDFIKRKDEIIEYIEKSSDETRRTFKRSNYPQVEESLFEYCTNNEIFTRQQFFDQCKNCFANLDKSSNKSGFCGSWSWCKRFFDRHPQFKSKLVKGDGEPLDKSELSIKEERRSINDSIKNPEFEAELAAQCLQYNCEDLTNVFIAELAMCIFDDMQLQGNFNPSSMWVKKFLARHPEIISRNYTNEEYIEEEYILEEIECSDNNNEEFEAMSDVKYEVIEHEDAVTDVDAINSLNLLLKYSQQKNNPQLMNLLLECKDILENSL